KQINQMPLEKMKIPMYVVATELQHGEKTIFNYGNTGQAVRASVSIPSMFIPTMIHGKEYVDGGLVSPVPVNIINVTKKSQCCTAFGSGNPRGMPKIIRILRPNVFAFLV
ncbi:patatin-like phospholipase family protein, partial [Vogesella mureinivorans]|uniref:patatin-like phospholipase family protein n=1 Tax=Vogesella mureinivorans TaxID=657276 RepID=UPI0019818182